MAQKKKFSDLDLSNAFMFAAALADPEICRMILEMILDRPVMQVRVHTEHAILLNSDFRSVRLDVYASDELEVNYNIEMENSGRDLPKRSRYHQAELDMAALRPGQNFRDLGQAYVVFICSFDPFGEKLYRYTFEERCLETGEPLGDETKKIFLNTRGEIRGNVPEVLIHFLRYVEESTDSCVEAVQDPRIVDLHDRITQIKKNQEWEGRYMTFEELLLERELEGRKLGAIEGRRLGTIEGRKLGESKMLSLLRILKKDNPSAIERIIEDPEFCQEMLKKYKI